LQLLQEKLTNELQFHADGRQSSCWLSLGSILFFQLLGGMQSLTDFRHCVVQPTQLLIAQSLVQCPISCLSDLSSGIILSSILSDYSSKTHETIPELLIFLQRAYDFLLSSNQELRFDFKADMSLPWKVFLPSSALVDHYPSIVNSLLTLTDSSIQNYQPESLVGINIRLEKLISLNIRESVFKPFQLLWAKHSEHLRLTPMPLRKSLFWRPSKKVIEEMLTPDYEVDYKMKTATPGVNPEKMKLKVLNKQLKREQKASMRELRRDSEFLDQEYFTEKSKTLSENKAERFRNYSWLEQEQATLNQQVRKSDKDPIKGGGSGGVPKKQRRR
jgi:nucleolar protein 14